eukprot:PhM_4_TR8273/c2_g1_i1/m.53439
MASSCCMASVFSRSNRCIVAVLSATCSSVVLRSMRSSVCLDSSSDLYSATSSPRRSAVFSSNLILSSRSASCCAALALSCLALVRRPSRAAACCLPVATICSRDCCSSASRLSRCFVRSLSSCASSLCKVVRRLARSASAFLVPSRRVLLVSSSSCRRTFVFSASAWASALRPSIVLRYLRLPASRLSFSMSRFRSVSLSSASATSLFFCISAATRFASRRAFSSSLTRTSTSRCFASNSIRIGTSSSDAARRPSSASLSFFTSICFSRANSSSRVLSCCDAVRLAAASLCASARSLRSFATDSSLSRNMRRSSSVLCVSSTAAGDPVRRAVFWSVGAAAAVFVRFDVGSDCDDAATGVVGVEDPPAAFSCDSNFVHLMFEAIKSSFNAAMSCSCCFSLASALDFSFCNATILSLLAERSRAKSLVCACSFSTTSSCFFACSFSSRWSLFTICSRCCDCIPIAMRFCLMSCSSRARSSSTSVCCTISLPSSSSTCSRETFDGTAIWYCCSCRRSRSTMAVSSLILRWLGSSFTTQMFTISRAREAYRSVLTVSSKLTGDGDTAATMHVRLFPPSESDSTHVSIDSRYGGIPLPLPELWSASASMTRPNVVRDKLIFVASLNCTPSAPDECTRSEPARSTRLIFDHVVSAPVGPGLHNKMLKMAWLRLLRSFIFVAAMCRSWSPLWSSRKMSLSDDTLCVLRPSTNGPVTGSWRTLRLPSGSPSRFSSRSMTRSL